MMFLGQTDWLKPKIDQLKTFIREYLLSLFIAVISCVGVFFFQVTQWLDQHQLQAIRSSSPVSPATIVGLLSAIGLIILLSRRRLIDHWLKLGAVYLLYPIFSRTITASYYINDPKVSVLDLEKLSRQGELFPWFVSILVIGMLIRYFWSDFSIRVANPATDLSLATLFALIPFTDGRLAQVILPLLNQLMDEGQSITFVTWQVLFPRYVCFVLLNYALMSAIRGILSNRANVSLAIFSSFSIAVFLNLALQTAYKGDGRYYGYVTVPGATTYQLAFFTFIFLVCYLLVNRYLLATLFTVPIAIMLAMANQLKFEMRAEPLLVTDFVWLRELGFLASFIEKTILLQLSLAFLLVTVCYVMFRRYLLKGRIVSATFLRLALLLSLYVVSHHVTQLFRAEKEFKIAEDVPVLTTLNNQLDLNWLGFTMTARYKSLAFVWTKQLTKSVMDKPEGYTSSRMTELMEKYQLVANQMNQTRTKDISDQTFIFILSESFADPLNVPGVSLSEEPIPHIKALQSVTTSGFMYSDFYGGGTANLEYQSLTGLPFGNFSPMISIAYAEVFPKMSYVPSLSWHFSPDNRLVLHPYGAGGYNRSSVYRKLGFDTFMSQDSTTTPFEPADPLGIYVGDASVYANILKKLDSEKNQFFSVITMQNHMPWVMSEPSHLTGQGQGFTEAENNNLTSYARLLYHTDQATKAFLDELALREQDITVVFYGDHLPGLYPAETFETRPEAQYETNYFIWSNRQPHQKLDYPLIGANDFVASVLEHTNSRVTPYQALLTSYLHEVSSNAGELTDAQLDVAMDLMLLQYDLTAGKGYLAKHPEFFEGKSK